ncbi:prolyl oligopeptidase family serine peptidase [Maribacter sp.]|nr:prolyl oligopeptidase family serine peptidase [Maribacter sp.]
MKRTLLLLWITTTLLNCSSQEPKLFSKEDNNTLSDSAFYYERTYTNEEGEDVLLPEFKYLDSIQISNITYLSDNLKIKGFCITPKKKGKYPVIIYNRGGSYDFGALTVPMISNTLGELANKGYVILCSQYRGNSGSEGQEEFGGNDVNDVLNLIDVADEIEYADPEKIGMYGWSRGGMMTYIALPQTNRIKAAVVGGAVSDFRLKERNRPGFTDMIPNYETNKEAELDRRSAVLWADKFSKEVPILMLHGTSDWRVKPEQSLKMALEFEKYRIPYRLIMFEGGDHGINEHRPEVDNQVIRWFDTYLKNGSSLPNMEYHGQ